MLRRLLKAINKHWLYGLTSQRQHATVFTLYSVCDWVDRENMLIEVDRIVKRQIQMFVVPSVQPFLSFACLLDPMLALEFSRKDAEHCSLVAAQYSLAPFSFPPALPVTADGGSRRLRVGYVSIDFGNRPLSHLMGSVFGMHNRKNIEVQLSLFEFSMSQAYLFDEFNCDGILPGFLLCVESK